MVANSVAHQSRQFGDVPNNQLAPHLLKEPLAHQRAHLARHAFAMRPYPIGQFNVGRRRSNAGLIVPDAGLDAKPEQFAVQTARHVQRAEFEDALRQNPNLPSQLRREPVQSVWRREKNRFEDSAINLQKAAVRRCNDIRRAFAEIERRKFAEAIALSKSSDRNLFPVLGIDQNLKRAIFDEIDVGAARSLTDDRLALCRSERTSSRIETTTLVGVQSRQKFRQRTG